MKNNQNNEIMNSEILFLFEASFCNPNGDPDEENRPRMDPATNTNLVSDVRLKRYFRDYISHRFGEQYIYVNTTNGKNVESDQRIKDLKNAWRNDGEDRNFIISKCIDVRLFGAIIAIKGKKGGSSRGSSIKFTGPVQFTWGFSLHPVEIVESSTITSVFVGRSRDDTSEESSQAYGTMGKDWRVYYSLIGFYGVISGNRSKETKLQKSDIEILDNVIWDSIKKETITRSKIGQSPKLYLRIEYKDKETMIGDLRKYINVRYNEPIRKFSDLEIDFTPLVEVLKSMEDRIEKIFLINSEDMSEIKKALENIFGNKLQELPHKEFNIEKHLTCDL